MARRSNRTSSPAVLTVEQVAADPTYCIALRNIVKGKYAAKPLFCAKFHAWGLTSSQWASGASDLTADGRRAAALAGAFD